MYCTIAILCLECFHCYVIIIDCLLTSFDMLYFSTDGCINKSLTYLLTYCWVYVCSRDRYSNDRSQSAVVHTIAGSTYHHSYCMVSSCLVCCQHIHCCCLLISSSSSSSSRPWPVSERSCASCPEEVALVASDVPNQVQACTGDVHHPHTSVPRLPDRFCTPLQQR